MSYPDVKTSNYPQVGDPDPTAGVPAEQRCGLRSDGIGRYRCTLLTNHPDPRCLAGDGSVVVARWDRPGATWANRADAEIEEQLARVLTVAEVAQLLHRPLGTVRRWVLSGELVPDAHVGRTPVFYLHRVAPRVQIAASGEDATT